MPAKKCRTAKSRKSRADGTASLLKRHTVCNMTPLSLFFAGAIASLEPKNEVRQVVADVVADDGRVSAPSTLGWRRSVMFESMTRLIRTRSSRFFIPACYVSRRTFYPAGEQ